MMIELLIGVVIFLVVLLLFQQWSHHQQQKMLLKALLSKDVHEFKTVQEPQKTTSQPTDELVALSDLSDDEYAKLVLHEK